MAGTAERNEVIVIVIDSLLIDVMDNQVSASGLACKSTDATGVAISLPYPRLQLGRPSEGIAQSFAFPLVISVARSTAKVLAVTLKLRRFALERNAALKARCNPRLCRAEVLNPHALDSLAFAGRATDRRRGSCSGRRSNELRCATDHTGNLDAPPTLICRVAGVLTELVRVRLESAGRTVKFISALGAVGFHTANYTTVCG